MRYIAGLALLGFIAGSANGCSSSSSAQSPPVLQPVVVSGDQVLSVTVNDAGAALFWFTATGVIPAEVWYSDGLGNAFPLSDLVPALEGANCNSYQPLAKIVGDGNAFYFFADDGVNGCEVWRTDGTAAGTTLFADIIPGPDGLSLTGEIVAGGNNLYVSGVFEPFNFFELHVVNLN